MKTLMDTRSRNEGLVDKARKGDAAAFNELVKVYRTRLASVVASRLGQQLRGRVDAEDVVQEVLLWAFKSIKRFEWQGEDSFFHWLKGIADHAILKVANREKKNLALPLLSDRPASESPPSKVLRRNERFDRFQASLDSLSPDHREVILLARIERLKFNEIARKMNRSTDAVKQLLRRALKELKTAFGETESLHLPDRNLKLGGHNDGEQ